MSDTIKSLAHIIDIFSVLIAYHFLKLIKSKFIWNEVIRIIPVISHFFLLSYNVWCLQNNEQLYLNTSNTLKKDIKISFYHPLFPWHFANHLTLCFEIFKIDLEQKQKGKIICNGPLKIILMLLKHRLSIFNGLKQNKLTTLMT